MSNNSFGSISPQCVNDRNIYDLIHWLDKLFQDKKESYVKFLARRGASAQQLLDLLQDVIKFGAPLDNSLT
jgi:hypothetical protein